MATKLTNDELAQLAARIEIGELIPPREYPLLLQAIQAAQRLHYCDLSLRGALRQREALMKLSKAQDCLLACYRVDANPGRMSQAVDRVERNRAEVARMFKTESLEGRASDMPKCGGEDTEGNPPHPGR